MHRRPSPRRLTSGRAGIRRLWRRATWRPSDITLGAPVFPLAVLVGLNAVDELYRPHSPFSYPTSATTSASPTGSLSLVGATQVGLRGVLAAGRRLIVRDRLPAAPGRDRSTPTRAPVWASHGSHRALETGRRSPPSLSTPASSSAIRLASRPGRWWGFRGLERFRVGTRPGRTTMAIGRLHTGSDLTGGCASLGRVQGRLPTCAPAGPRSCRTGDEEPANETVSCGCDRSARSMGPPVRQ